MIRRPSREWLEALVSSALVAGCAGPTAPVPPPAPSPGPVPAPEQTATPIAPASSGNPAPATSAPDPAPARATELPPFDATACKAPSAKPEPACGNDADGEERAIVANLLGVRTACALDALVVFQVDPPRRAGSSLDEVRELARSGEPCAAASDRPGCEARLQSVAFPRDGGIADFGGRVFVVAARGDALQLISSREHVMRLIGPVDSRQDAATVLWLEGWGNTCAKLQAQGNSFVLPKNEVGMICPPMIRGNAGGYAIPRPPAGYDLQGRYRLQVDPRGKVQVNYLGGAPKQGDPGFGIACGRRPEGMVLAGSRASAADEVGCYLASCAELEAAAVIAFELMARELAQHGAPAAYVERCLLAAADERRHTELMTAAARRYGTEPVLPAAFDRPLPSLLELARENTIEGCVRETWGALSATLQARSALDPALAELYASIAPDELAHAQLAWDLQSWFAERTGGHAQLAGVASRARAELLAEQREPAAAVRAVAGAPALALARRLISQLAA